MDNLTAETPETVVEDARPVEPSFEDAIDKDLNEIWEKSHPPRTEDGKFTPKETAETPEITDQAQTKPEEPAAPAIQMPVSWSPDRKAEWEALPSTAREYIAKREQEAHSQISQLGQQVKTAQPLFEVLERHRAAYEGKAAPAEAIERLFAANNYLERDPVNAIQWLASQYGVDLQALAGDPNSQPDAQVSALKNEIAQLKALVGQTTQRVMSREQQEQEAKIKAVEAEIEAFAKDKPEWNTLEAEILANVGVLRTLNPALSHKDLLEQAYERAVFANPQTRAAQLARLEKEKADKAAEEAKKRAIEAKKASSTNVKSSPGSHAATSLDDDLKAVARKFYG